MKLRQLFESSDRSVGIIFGRFNPPHQGHKAAWEMAAHNDHWFVGTNKSTEGPKDPLPYAVKTKAMVAVMPELKGHIIPETSWLTLASKVYKEYGDIRLNVYTDEDWVTKTLIQYNGVEGPHGLYKFKHIEQRPTPRLSSATALRAAVQAGDRDAFAKAAGIDADTPVGGKPFFDVVAHYLLPYGTMPKKAPKKVKQPEPNVAEDNDPCWKDYKQVGMKKKGGKQVPNCVPKEAVQVAENYHSDLMKQTYAKFFKPAPPKTVLAVKKFLSGVIVSLGTAQDNDYDEENPEEISWEQDLSDVREAYNKLRSNGSPNWFDLADAVLSYDTEFRESMIEWAEEELGNKLVNLLWDEVWEAKHQISRSDGSYNVKLGQEAVNPAQQAAIAIAKKKKQNEWSEFKQGLAELSSEMLGRYKKAAGADASKADKAGDFEKGNKRFKGIVKATNKQFDNDMKGKNNGRFS